MEVKQLVSEMDALVSRGQIVDATAQFFGEHARTQDFDGTITTTKAEMLTKMEGFASAIQQVNGITHHRTLVNGNVTMSEYTFDFDMKDGSKVLWHEIIRRIWENGKVVQEQYFKN